MSEPDGPFPRRASRLSDPRARRSRQAIGDALLRLVRDRPFERITLRDIAAEAGVSYPTIFNHYASKADLFQDIVRQGIIDLLAAFREGRAEPGWRPGRGITAYIVAHRDRWHTLLTAGASEAMRAEFIRCGRELADDRTDLGHGVPIDVVSGVIASGVFEIIAWWLTQRAGPAADDVAAMLERMVIEPALNLPSGYFADR